MWNSWTRPAGFPPPDARKPGLSFPRLAGRAVIMGQFSEAGRRQVPAPSLQVMICAIAPTAPAFFISSVRIRAKQHAAGFQTGMQLQQDARQLLAGDVKKRRVGEYAIEMVLWQIELEKILPPNFAAAVGARHGGEAWGAFQTYRDMAEFGEDHQVAPGPAAKIEEPEGPFALDILQHCRDVLADVVTARAFPEIFGASVVILQREGGNLFQVLRRLLHVGFGPVILNGP